MGRKNRSVSWLLWALVVLGLGCGSGGSSGSAPPGPTALFGVRPDDSDLLFLDVPFPNDAFFVPDSDGFDHLRVAGLDAVAPMLSDVLKQGLAQLDGFGLSTAIYFHFDGDLDLGSLPATVDATTAAGASVFLIDASNDPGPHAAQPIELHWDAPSRTLALLPLAGVPLKTETRYAAVITTHVQGVNSTTGVTGPVQPSESFSTAIDKNRDPQNATLDRIQNRYDDALNVVLGATGLTRADLACMTVFTTQSAAKPMTAIRAQLERRPVPQLETSDPTLTYLFATPSALDDLLGVASSQNPGLDNPGGVAHGAIGAVLNASYLTDWYKSPALGIPDRLLRGQFDDDRFVVVDGEPKMQRQDRVPVTLVLPSAPPPPAGYPVVIYQHGLGGSRTSVFGTANTFAQAGYATVAIDAVAHGLRYQTTDQVHNFTGAPGPDGFAEVDALQVPVGFFEAFLDLLAIRDNFRQTAVDLMELVRLLRSPDLDLSIVPGAPHLDGSHIVVVGNSLGAIMAAQFAAIDPFVEGVVLNVGGGGLANYLLVNSPGEGAGNIPIIATLFGLDISKVFPDRWLPFVSVAQTIVEAGDSLALAANTVADPVTIAGFDRNSPKNVMQIEVMGDEVVPNPSNEVLARALGLDLLEPSARAVDGLASISSVASGNRTVDGHTVVAALVQLNPATHGSDLDNQRGDLSYQPGFPHPGPKPFPLLATPIPVEEPIDQVQASVLRFVQTVGAGHAEIASPETPNPF